MNIEIIIAIVAVAVVAAAILRKEFRREFTVAQGFAGLLYQHGKSADQFLAGRYVRWARGFALTQIDLRKATFAVAGQEILTADNVVLTGSWENPVETKKRVSHEK